MRSVLPFVLLPALALSIDAQSCLPADRISGVTITGATCVDGATKRCEPGDALTFRANLNAGPSTPATCATSVTWDFGDGTAPVTSTDPVQHTYDGARRVSGQATAHLSGGAQAQPFNLIIAPGLISLSAGGNVITEGDGADVTITRTGNLSSGGTIEYFTTGTLEPVHSVMTFVPGEASKTLIIRAADDSIYNGNALRTGEFVLRDPNNGWLFENPILVGGDPRASVSFEIRDNDLLAIHRCQSSGGYFYGIESNGEVVFTLTRSGNTTGTTTGYAYIVGDWLLDLKGKFTTVFNPGETIRTIHVPLVNDTTYTGNQQSQVICGGEGPGTSETTSGHDVFVFDDEPFPTVLVPNHVEVYETDAPQTVTIPIQYIPAFPSARLRASITHRGTDDNDVELVTRDVVDKIELLVRGDDDAESDEGFIVELAGVYSKEIEVAIRDDDRVPFPFAFDQESYRFNEADGGTIGVRRTGDASATAVVLLKMRPAGTSSWGEPIRLNFVPNETKKDVPLTLDDALYTGQRTIVLGLEFDEFTGATTTALVDDDETMPALSIGDASVREGNVDQRTRLELPITLSAPLGAALNVGVTATPGTADATDVALGTQTATIAAGQRTGVVAFEIAGDLTLEADETFTATITNCCNGLATVERRAATATIVNDDDAPTSSTYRLFLGPTTVAEKDKWLTIPVRRFGRVSAPTSATLRVTASDWRTFAPRHVSFGVNETQAEARFYIDDFAYSGDTDVQIQLFDDDQLVDSASMKILEDEGMPSVYLWAYSVREGPDAKLPVEVRSYPPWGRAVTAHIRAKSGTAMSGADFAPFDTDIEIPPLTNIHTLAIPVVDDPDVEGDEKLTVEVTLPGGYFDDFTPSILDNDNLFYVRNEPNVQRGTLTTITVELPAPAPVQDSIVFLGDPYFFEGPTSVVVPRGARSVSFQVRPRINGDIAFAVGTPGYMPAGRFTSRMNVYELHDVTFTPAALELEPGTAARVDVSFDPASADFFVQSADRHVAAAEVLHDGTRRYLMVYAASQGETQISVTPYPGRATTQLHVAVKEPTVPGTRKRGVRH